MRYTNPRLLYFTRPASESIPVQKWDSPQGGQVHYTDAAVEHQMTAGVFSCLAESWQNPLTKS